MDDLPDQGFETALLSQFSQSAPCVLGRRLHFFDSIDSTNASAAELARAGAAEGTVVIADTQTGGKGRLGRRWVSPPGVNLYLSVILRPRKPVSSAPQLSLLAAVAVAETIVQQTQLVPSIKWPNDVLVSGKKVCGILTELQAKGQQLRAVITGIGVNINAPLASFPEELHDKASSLFLLRGGSIDRAVFTARLLTHLEKLYVLWLEEGFPVVGAAWEGYAHELLGKPITVTTPEETLAGTALGLDRDGALLVQTECPARNLEGNLAGRGDQPHRVRRILAGDVTVVDGYRKTDTVN